MFIGALTLSTSSILNASPPVQANCFVQLATCMNDAELEYTGAIGSIEGAQETAERRYKKAVQACVGAYRDCQPKN